MLGAEIESHFQDHPLLNRHFVGVLAADELKNAKFGKSSFAIVNTDVLTGGGSNDNS